MIEIYRGDSKTIKVSVTNNGEVMDLTAYVARLSLKRSEQQIDTDLQLTVDTIGSPELGNIVFELTPDKTKPLLPGQYYYDVEIKQTNTDKVYTVAKGIMRVLTDITTN